jgi:hypothetical protein
VVRNYINSQLNIIVLISFIVCQVSVSHASAQNIAITIHLRGVYESNISLLSLTGSGTFKPIKEVNGIPKGETAPLEVEEKYLPGEFVLRFDYKENTTSTPYPSEKRLLIGKQDLELWVNPKY